VAASNCVVLFFESFTAVSSSTRFWN